MKKPSAAKAGGSQSRVKQKGKERSKYAGLSSAHGAYKLVLYHGQKLIGLRETAPPKRQIGTFGGKYCDKDMDQLVGIGQQALQMLSDKQCAAHVLAWCRAKAG